MNNGNGSFLGLSAGLLEAGLVMAQKKWGKLKLERVMQSAILLAKTGFTLAYEDGSTALFAIP